MSLEEPLVLVMRLHRDLRFIYVHVLGLLLLPVTV